MVNHSLELDSICQPPGLVIDRLVDIVESSRWTHFDAAIAYAVVGAKQHR
jgi:hypothetical protein